MCYVLKKHGKHIVTTEQNHAMLFHMVWIYILVNLCLLCFFSADILQQDKHFLEVIVVLVMIISIMCVEYLGSVCLLCV